MMLKTVLFLSVVATAAAAQRPLHPPIHYRVDGMERVSVARDLVYKTTTVAGRANQPLALDVYRAAAARAPFVVFVHGGLSPSAPPTAKDWESYQSWGRVAAASGLTAVIPNHRMNTNDNVVEAVADVRDAIAYVRDHAGEHGLDGSRMCVAFFSAGGPIASAWLRERPPYLRCVVLYYPYLDLEHLRERTPFRGPYPSGFVDSLRDYSPRTWLTRGPAQLPPLLLARAGQDAIPFLNTSVARFIADAVANNVTLDFVNHPAGAHGFDLLTDDDRTRDIIAQTLAFLQRHLR